MAETLKHCLRVPHRSLFLHDKSPDSPDPSDLAHRCQGMAGGTSQALKMEILKKLGNLSYLTVILIFPD
jgi:hypothetical protein